MRSLKFPNMFEGNSSAVWKADESLKATKQNTKLLLNSERNSLIGDPYFGLAKLTFDQNSYILQDALADVIYTQIALFLPQVQVNRNNIKVVRDKIKGKVYCTFTGLNKLDYTVNTYNIVLLSESDF